MILKNLEHLVETPDLASRKWVYEQFDSQVMNDTIAINGDASLVRVHGTQKALALTVDCNVRYVEADPYLGAIQAVAETYRNISSTGAKPLAITNCLNFGNPQRPEIMGQIVKAIRGITEACKFLDYPVVSGNVSLYNETDGKAIKPTPSIGGVGLLKDLTKRCDIKFKNLNDEILMVGKSIGHLSCTAFNREIIGDKILKNPPVTDLKSEKENSEFIRELIANSLISSCHDISEGGMAIALFEKCTNQLGCEINIDSIKLSNNLSDQEIFFGEEQSRYIISVKSSMVKEIVKKAEKQSIAIYKIGKVIPENIVINNDSKKVSELIKANEKLFEKAFS